MYNKHGTSRTRESQLSSTSTSSYMLFALFFAMLLRLDREKVDVSDSSTAEHSQLLLIPWAGYESPH